MEPDHHLARLDRLVRDVLDLIADPQEVDDKVRREAAALAALAAADLRAGSAWCGGRPPPCPHCGTE